MAAKTGDRPKGETVQFKSPAEFFADNQNIAGFDNEGKALYTTIRELVENSLDAAESAGRLPDVTVLVEEMDTPTFNTLRGIETRVRVDASLYARDGDAAGGGGGAGAGGAKGAKRRRTGEAAGAPAAAGAAAAAAAAAEDAVTGGAGSGGSGGAKEKAGGGDGGGGKRGAREKAYFRVTCRDNGCGMAHDDVPNMLGRVLSGSKYGVRQTRGKFGLGAKMALIWAKKSTGMPIEVTTAHGPPARGAAAAAAAAAAGAGGGPPRHAAAPAKVTFCRLDIDIHRNVPHVLEHTSRDNVDGWLGTQIGVVIAGAWGGVYKARVLQYFQQLAVITPYAQFGISYANVSGGKASAKGDFSFLLKRRSTQVPPPPLEVRHHPSSVNDLLVRQLIDAARARHADVSLAAFLTGWFACIDKPLAARLIAELGPDFSAAMPIAGLSTKGVHQLTRLLALAQIDPPSGACLSPAGEYNLRLGILKELRPDLVATARGDVRVFEGHPFIVEAGVALGGRGSEGLTVHRFANRIPLLFEGGADVATRTATTRIPWAAYKIDPVRDKIGVFVSIVSTKIPFKGTGKEYIGDDIAEMREAVKSALQACCSQLRVKLMRASALRARANRRKTLARYVPDVARALSAALKRMTARDDEAAAAAAAATASDDEGGGAGGGGGGGGGAGAGAGAVALPKPGVKRAREDEARGALLSQWRTGDVTEATIAAQLLVAVEKADLDAALKQASALAGGLGAGGDDEADAHAAAPVFIAPTPLAAYEGARDVHFAGGALRLLPGAVLEPGDKLARMLYDEAQEADAGAVTADSES